MLDLNMMCPWCPSSYCVDACPKKNCSKQYFLGIYFWEGSRSCTKVSILCLSFFFFGHNYHHKHWNKLIPVMTFFEIGFFFFCQLYHFLIGGVMVILFQWQTRLTPSMSRITTHSEKSSLTAACQALCYISWGCGHDHMREHFWSVTRPWQHGDWRWGGVGEKIGKVH